MRWPSRATAVSRSNSGKAALDAGLIWLPGVLLALALGLHAAGFWVLAPVRQLDAAWHDARLAAYARATPDERVVIVDIDERSLAALGRWPWSRDRLAGLIERLFEKEEVGLVGLDMILAEPEVPAGLALIDEWATGLLRDDAAFQAQWARRRPELDNDARLTGVLARFPVVLAFHGFSGTEFPGATTLPSALLPAGAAGPLTRFDRYGGNLPALTQAARGAGFLDVHVDADGVRRRAPLLAEAGGGVHGSFALAMALAARGDRSPTVVGPAGGARQLRGSTTAGLPAVSLGAWGDIVLPYAQPAGLARRHSAVDVLAGRVPPGSLRGRLVLVGTTAPGLADRHATPVSEHLPGVQGHAALLSALLDGHVPHEPPRASLWQALALLLVLVGLGPLMWRLSPVPAALLTVSGVTVLAGANAYAWAAHHWSLPLAAPALLAMGLFAWRLFHGHVRERHERRRIELLFGQYVPPELVDTMSRNPAHYDMQGRSVELTVLFADLRGFTQLSETLPPTELVALMNAFFSEMTDIVRAHGGTLDKYIGDSVMAFWGAPVADPDHAWHAVQAAQAMCARLPALNATFERNGWPALSLGVGINTGTVVVGDLGSRHRRAYTVLGDAVNVASRLQGLGTRLGQDILLGEATWAQLPPMVCRHLGTQRLRGRRLPVEVYTPVSAARL
jgi:adenylate cyclase